MKYYQKYHMSYLCMAQCRSHINKGWSRSQYILNECSGLNTNNTQHKYMHYATNANCTQINMHIKTIIYAPSLTPTIAQNLLKLAQ